ncbi:oxidoreductase [Novosphingobium taihuense]|uniref:2,4-dienoyl-CoA reductase-like NADH-dependent reductase (Old Yellow Enzyme family) n=1 Tax=Novosphingobium taihuense TaxID=260085 RepID=A0A7W7EXL0_9SPHN|nr:FAD-dependent oxidoreductase [Novosphingobium taihuense]MBB4615455.1 2,4-dienoyl-CoA reductase-like NADH-dependent reductase (Old Yellow Enzyme family) [Novosphingobium taihuense]TWH82097.1 2,4-dienoyl-CoA reductase-like NADH-dependent reductase (Old Yellow Enzyme family) [Novosphingobium taihuense]
MALEKIFQPLKIGPITVPNRVTRSAHGGLEMSPRMTDDYIAYHARRGSGGCGLTILGAASVHPSSMLYPYGLFYDGIVDDYRRLMAAVEPSPMKVFAQLWHGGNLYPAQDGGPPWAVSDVPGMTGLVGQRMSEAMIEEVIGAYVRCARHARDGGLHGIEIHAAHGYLPQQFLSEIYNDRADGWGGSLENRMRFLLEIVRQVRSAVGGTMAVGVRLAASDMPGGVDEGINIKVLERLQAENLIDYVNISRGDYYRMDTMVGAMQNPTGYEVPSSGTIAAAATVPRLLAGRYRTLDDAEQLLRDGTADLVSMVRAQIADPDLVNKTREGRALEVRPCIGCNQHFRGGRWGCAVNAAAGIESRYDEALITLTETPRKVLVVGGGPAGLEAARVAAMRGHKVTLCEASPRLGGQLDIARLAPHSAGFGDIALWLEAEVYRLGVEVRLNTFMEEDEVIAEMADHVIVATGSVPRMDAQQHTLPSQLVPGADMPHVVSTAELLREKKPRGRTALVLDTVGDYEGLAATEHLLAQGLSVTYVTAQAALAWKNERSLAAWERFQALGGFTLLVRHHLVEIRENDVMVRPYLAAMQQVTAVPADTVVLITPNKPLREIHEALAPGNPNIRIVGDAREPRDLLRAIWEGHAAAREIH